MFWKTAINVCELFNWKVILPIHRNFIDTFKKVSHLLHWLLDLRSFYKKLHVVHEHRIFRNIWVENKLFPICSGKPPIFTHELV